MPSPADPSVRRQLRIRRAVLVVGAILGLLALGLGGCGSEGGGATVPDLQGLTEQEARASLRTLASGPNLKVEYQRSDGGPFGRVSSQEPEAGSDLGSVRTVTVVIAVGPDAPVPDVAGMERTKALKALQKAGFGARVVLEADPDVAPGTVVRTEPGRGKEAPKGSSVDVVVSSGGARVTMPDVVGEDQQEATADLEDLGLEVKVKRQASKRPKGTVIRQGPKAGQRVTAGSTVTIVVATPIPASTTTAAPTVPGGGTGGGTGGVDPGTSGSGGSGSGGSGSGGTDGGGGTGGGGGATITEPPGSQPTTPRTTTPPKPVTTTTPRPVTTCGGYIDDEGTYVTRC